MSSSQHTFPTRLGRFQNANEFIQAWLDYNSNNPLISKAGLTAFIADVIASNDAVDTAAIPVNDNRALRKPLVFKKKDTNPLCLESRYKAIGNYVSGEIGITSSAAKSIKAILRKIKPRYKKKETPPGEETPKSRSTAEASFTAMVGHGNTIIAIITALGVAYNPPDNNLKVPQMQALVDQVHDLNKLIAKKLEPLGTAEKARLKLYDGEDGMDDRIRLIKSYLGGFTPPKKHPHYIEFSQAIKGV